MIEFLRQVYRINVGISSVPVQVYFCSTQVVGFYFGAILLALSLGACSPHISYGPYLKDEEECLDNANLGKIFKSIETKYSLFS